MCDFSTLTYLFLSNCLLTSDWQILIVFLQWSKRLGISFELRWFGAVIGYCLLNSIRLVLPAKTKPFLLTAAEINLIKQTQTDSLLDSLQSDYWEIFHSLVSWCTFCVAAFFLTALNLTAD